MNKEELKEELFRNLERKDSLEKEMALKKYLTDIIDIVFDDDTVPNDLLKCLTAVPISNPNREKALQSTKELFNSKSSLAKTLDYSKKGYYVGVIGCIIGFAGLIVGIYPLVASLLI